MDLSRTYDVLMALNREAFAAGRYEIAYHALEAALWSAEGLGDDRRLAQVQALAAEQGAWIDANAPGHRLSSHSALGRTTQGVFASCARSADALLAGLRARRLQQKLAGPGG